MQEILPVHQLERFQQRHRDLIELRLRRRPAETLEPAGHGGAGLELHHHVGGAVRLEDVRHADDGRMLELGELLRFLGEALQRPLIDVLVGRVRPDAGAVAARKFARKMLLDCVLLGEARMLGEIGYAKAACRQMLDDAIPLQLEAGGQYASVLIRHMTSPRRQDGRRAISFA